MFIAGDPSLVPEGEVAATEVKALLLDHLFGGERTAERAVGSARAG